MLYKLYQLLSWLFFAISFPPFFLYSVVTGRHLKGMGQRLGQFGRQTPHPGHGDPVIWLHAASVGEVQVAAMLIEELKKQVPRAVFILSVMTEPGWNLAQQRLQDKARVIYAPLDLSIPVGLALKRLRPTVYICIETELWPTMLVRARCQGVKLALLNGRISEPASKRYALVRSLMQQLLQGFDVMAVITAVDAERYWALGAPTDRVQVLGNVKYDFIGQTFAAQTEAQCRCRLDLAPGQPMLVAGSTHGSEEMMLLAVYDALKARDHKMFNDLVLVVAPRHLARLAEIEAHFTAQEVSFERLSTIKEQGRRRTAVVLVDSIGELAQLYSAATFVFCGGSLSDRGGHNVMEAAVWGKPVLYGPGIKDFADAAELLEFYGGGFRINGVGQLVDTILQLAAQPEAYDIACYQARQAATSQQGSARRQARLILDLLQESDARSV